MKESLDILFIVLPYYFLIFENSTVKEAVSRATIILSLAVLAGALRRAGYKARILDLNLEDHPEEVLEKVIRESNPRYAGITFTTPLFELARRYSSLIKSFNPQTTVIGGGPHATVLPEDTLGRTDIDIVVKGEGDSSIIDILSGKPLYEVGGITFKQNGQVVSQPVQSLIPDLDSLAMPALDLYNIPSYTHPKVVARRNPVASMETSRGCYARCSFCNKSIFHTKFRFKSPQRVIDEMKFIMSLGFKEIHIVDDMFTADLGRVKEICKKILDEKLDISWYPRGGIRVDKVDEEIFSLMKRAGVWHIPFGIESGNQEVLNRTNKRITLEQVRRAVSLVKKAGIETEGYFMLGLPGETKETIEDTLKFSLSIGLDYAKYAITVPLPGTTLFEEWDREGCIKTKDWSKYTFSTPTKELYDHPSVSWKIIDEYYRAAPRRFYLRPTFITRRFVRSLKQGELLEDIKTFLKIKWWG